MVSRKRFAFIIIACLLFLSGLLDLGTPSTTVHSQTQDDQDCAEIITDALAIVGSSCSDIERGQVCYGHGELSATLTEDATETFDDVGDIISVENLVSLNTDAASPESRNLGAAVMLFDANTPSDSAGLMLLLIGDAQLSTVNRGDSSSCSISNPGPNNLNIRGGASIDLGVRGRFEVGATGTAVGRNEAGDWVLISVDDIQGWVFAPTADLSCDLGSLPVLELLATTAPVDDLDSFVLNTGQSAACDIAPNGLMVRSPDGQQARLHINGVEMAISGTGFMTADPNGDMVVRGLDGQIDIIADGQTEVISANYSSSISLADGQAVSPPTTPNPILIGSERIDAALNATQATIIQNNIGIDRCLGTAISAVDYRSGPDDHFDVVGQLNADQEILMLRQINSVDETGWWQLSNSGWVPREAMAVTGDCSVLPGRRVLKTTIDSITMNDNAIPTCGIFWNAEQLNDSGDNGIELDSTLYFAEGTQVYLEATRDRGEIVLMAEGPQGVVVDEESDGQGLSAAKRFRVVEDGNYSLRGYSGGDENSAGIVFGAALCP